MKRTDYIDILKTINGKRFYSTILYPNNLPLSDNDTYIITDSTDSLTSIANTFYSDPELWWVVASVNNNVRKDTLRLQANLQLRIPDLDEYTSEFKKINRF
jgi:hypothetical protein